MKRSLKKYKGLPGGPNEKFSFEGYRKNSPDVNNPFNVILSNNITMKEKDGSPLKKGPLLGTDNLGNSKIMMPGADYTFPGNMVVETPLAKKGGQFQNSNITATNKLFAVNKLYKKRKKGKRARGIYNPKAKYTYDDGGQSGCPIGYEWNGIECIPNPFETRPSQRAAVYMDKDGNYQIDPAYQQYSQQKFDVSESNRKAQEFNKLYAQSKNYKRLLKKQGYTPEEIKDRINSVMNINDFRYIDEGPSWVGADEDTGKEFISYNVTDPGDWPGFDQIAAHEWGHVGVDSGANPLKPKEREEFINRINKEQAGVTGVESDLQHDMEPQENRADLVQLRQQLQEAGVFDSTKRKKFTKKDLNKYKEIMQSSEKNWDNMWNRMFRLYDDDSIIYFMNNVAKNNSDQDVQVAKYGFELDLTEDEIDKYVKGGYIVEDISVPSLTRMDDGGERRKRRKNKTQQTEEITSMVQPIAPDNIGQVIEKPEVEVNPAPERVPLMMKFSNEFQENNPYDAYYEKAAYDYLKKQKGWNEALGINKSNLPENVAKRIQNKYYKDLEDYVIKQAKNTQKQYFGKFDKKGNWISSSGKKNILTPTIILEKKPTGNGPWNNWGDGPIQMVYPEQLVMGPGAGLLGLVGRGAAKGIANLAKTSLVQGTKAALNQPIRNIPGFTVGNLGRLAFGINAALEFNDPTSGTREAVNTVLDSNKSAMERTAAGAEVGLQGLMLLDTPGMGNALKAVGKGVAMIPKAISNLSKFIGTEEGLVSNAQELTGFSIGSGTNFTRDIPNPDYYLDVMKLNKYNPKQKKYFESLIQTVKNQGNVATELQYDELQRIKTGDYNYGKKGYYLDYTDILNQPSEEILNKTGRSKEDWQLFINKLPDRYGKLLEEQFNSAYTPTEEQLSNLEEGKQQLINFYNSSEYGKRLESGLNIPSNEALDYQNKLINAINKTNVRYLQSQNLGSIESDAIAYTSGADASGTKLGIDFSKRGLNRPDAKYVVSHEFGHASLFDNKTQKLLENLPKLELDSETLKLWESEAAKPGGERYKDLIKYYKNPDEARQRGISTILFSKNSGISIDELVDMPYNQIIYLNQQGKIPSDVVSLRQLYDQKQLKSYLKNLFSIVGPIVIGGLGTNLALENKKQGGIVSDLTKKEIDDYIKRGYIVEEIFTSPLDEMGNGGEKRKRKENKEKKSETISSDEKIPESTYTPIDTNWLAANPGTYSQIVNKPEVPTERQGSDIGKLRSEYREKNPMDLFLDEKKRQYLKKNKGLNKAAGVTMENFPEDVLQNFMSEYDYKTNNYAVNKLGKKEGWNPRRRGEWVDELTPGEKDAVAESKYGSKLQPSYWSRALAGLQELANFGIKIDPVSPVLALGPLGLTAAHYLGGDNIQLENILKGEDVLKYNIPGLTKREQKEIAESKFGALETLAPMDIPGAAIANLVKNTGLTTGSDYKEQANALAGEKMANVSDAEAMAFNPLTYAGLEAIPELGVNLVKGIGRGITMAPEAISNLGKIIRKETPAFKSEINWRDWVKYKEDFDNNPNVIQELNDIEKSSKEAGTWMKNPDGTPFQGTPEQFVVQQSTNWKNAFPEYYGETLTTRSNNQFDTFDQSKFGATDDGWHGEGIYTYPTEDVKEGLGLLYGPNEYELYVNSANKGVAEGPYLKGSYVYQKDTNKLMKDFYDKYRKIKESGKWDDAVQRRFDTEYEDLNKYINAAKENNINDYTTLRVPSSDNEVIIPFNNTVKSAKGNILFDMTNPNIYKAMLPYIIPAGLGVGAASQMQGQESNAGYKKGGIVLELTEEEIENYRKRGYIIEEID